MAQQQLSATSWWSNEWCDHLIYVNTFFYSLEVYSCQTHQPTESIWCIYYHWLI